MLSADEYHMMTQNIVISPNKSLITSIITVLHNLIAFSTLSFQFSAIDPEGAIDQIIRLSPFDVSAIARDSNGSKYVLFIRFCYQSSCFQVY